MRIAILGTRGIPNRYGGFERFAEVVSPIFAESGHNVFVLSHNNDYPESTDFFNGVCIVNIAVPTWLPRNVQTLLYDLKSLMWASKHNIDAILECGYSHAIWLIFYRKMFWRKIVTNTDGLEFNRKKWSFFTKLFLRVCEGMAVTKSGSLVCDNAMLVDHFRHKYNVTPTVIPYGAFPVNETFLQPELQQYDVANSFLMVTRFTPENSIELVLDVFSKNGLPLAIVGDYNSHYGKLCFSKYQKYSNIKFLGSIYNQDKLNSLRYNALAYIHGHSVGGTNPSLLEAMACKCFVIAHDNVFNRSVLNNSGLYFTTSVDLMKCLNQFRAKDQLEVQQTKQQNYQRITDEFNWHDVASRYLKLFSEIKQHP